MGYTVHVAGGLVFWGSTVKTLVTLATKLNTKRRRSEVRKCSWTLATFVWSALRHWKLLS